jgi:hypothetical protein
LVFGLACCGRGRWAFGMVAMIGAVRRAGETTRTNTTTSTGSSRRSVAPAPATAWAYVECGGRDAAFAHVAGRTVRSLRVPRGRPKAASPSFAKASEDKRPPHSNGSSSHSRARALSPPSGLCWCRRAHRGLTPPDRAPPGTRPRRGDRNGGSGLPHVPGRPVGACGPDDGPLGRGRRRPGTVRIHGRMWMVTGQGPVLPRRRIGEPR